jgi:signal transduction histidine kinase
MNGYDSYYVAQSLRPLRSGLILAIILYLVFGVLDFYAAPVSYLRIWVIRLLVVSVLFGAWNFSYSEKFFNYFTVITSICAFTVSYGILGMLWLLHPDELAILEYHNGLVLCLFGASTIFRLRSRHSLAVSSVAVVGYGLLAYFHLGLFSANLAKLLNNVFFITSGAIMGLVYMSSLEKVLKINYFNDQVIRKEKDRLAKVKIDLEVSDSMKNKLLAIISHDIRGPLSSIKGLLLLCQFQRITQKEFDVHLKKLVGAVDNTSMLLENLLCWSTHDGNQNKAGGVEVDVRNVVNDIFSLFEEPARIKNNNLINSVNPQTIIQSDQSVIKLIIRNFIANAIKFTENGLITVRADVITEHQVKISVNDTGSGMPQEVTAKLFNWGLKQSCEGTKGEKGAGIGLLICHDFAEKIKGSISYDTKVGFGTTFSLVLPTSPSKNLQFIN